MRAEHPSSTQWPPTLRPCWPQRDPLDSTTLPCGAILRWLLNVSRSFTGSFCAAVSSCRRETPCSCHPVRVPLARDSPSSASMSVGVSLPSLSVPVGFLHRLQQHRRHDRLGLQVCSPSYHIWKVPWSCYLIRSALSNAKIQEIRKTHSEIQSS